VPAVAVWIDVPLEVALRRNAARAGAERIAEHVIHHVHDQLEPPSAAEGFSRVVRVGVDEAEG
jgi:predicted kinase